MQHQLLNEEFIAVIPYYQNSNGSLIKTLQVSRLFFWNNNTFEHPVKEDTLKFFLFHAELYGAAIFPDCPELGCSAVGEPDYARGETLVAEISYKGSVIYRRSK